MHGLDVAGGVSWEARAMCNGLQSVLHVNQHLAKLPHGLDTDRYRFIGLCAVSRL
jgi:hypothetical protein